MVRPMRPLSLRTLVAGAAVLVLSLLSCGREITGPESGVRYATGLSFVSLFPGPLASVAQGAGSVVPFERVRVVFRREDTTIALDTMVSFPSNADSMALDLRVPLSSAAGSSGEALELTLAYVNAAGDTVFRGGPVQVMAQVRAPGAPPPSPVPVALTYTGPGANAASVTVDVDSIVLTSGDPFTVSAVARDGQGNVLSGVPLVFSSLDRTRALVTSAASGAGTTLPSRGAARIRVELPSGAASDTTFLTILPRPSNVALVSGGGQSAFAGDELPQPVVVRVLATDGQPLVGVPVLAAVTSGEGSISPDSAITGTSGEASFTWTLGYPGAQAASFTSPVATALTVNATATANNAVSLVITEEPGAIHQAGDSLPRLTVEARTAGGARDTTYSDSVSLEFAAAPAGAGITGVSRVRAVNGTARFEDYRLTLAGTYRLRVTAPGLFPDTAAVLTIVPRAASAIALESGGGQVAVPGAALSEPIVLRVTDGYDNGVAGVIVGFSVALGSVSASADTSDADGFVSVGWTLGVATGTQTLTATAAGLSGSPLAVTATGSAAIVATTIAPTTDTLTSIGAQRLLVATARDGANNAVGGSFTWATRNAAVATVNDSGRVFAVANGATWIVATEAGGTRDSARIVVEQRLATIRVTPDPRTIYLGASYAFAAEAVDGLGTAMTVQPSFSWSTASSAIASVTAAGVATGVGLGSTQVRATAGTVTGVAQLTVRTPITRIAVVRDSVGFVLSDTFSLAALARTRSYRAVAYDTLDAVMTGIAFAWASSNPSVAALDSVGATTARAVAVANGFTAVRASAQGVTGAAALTVAQVMTAVEVTPASVSVAPTGSVALTARRLDANGYFIPGGSFTWASADAGVATVSGTGVVTGVTIGGTTVTATSGTVTSPPATVTVTNSVPAILSFGRDTLAIGRSATNTPFPIYLSRPSASAVTVNLAVADTFAFFNPVTITIPAGSTVGTANLNGRNAGTTRVFAVDGSGTPAYAGDTAVLTVQSGVSFSVGGITLLVNDERAVQVRLTDPAPAGGTYITYEFGTAGRASVSPDPAFIPQGQLAADVVVRALSAGSTTIAPVAQGVVGAAMSVTTQAAVLAMQRPSATVGAGQYRSDWYVYTPSSVNVSVPVSLVSSDTVVATVTPQVTIPGGSNYVYFTVRSRAPGAATITAQATGWSSPAQGVIVTSPRLGLTGGGTLNTTSPAQGLTVYAQDSLRNAHWRTSALAISVSSSDTSVIRVQTPSVTIGADQYFVSGISVIPGGAPGTAWVRVSAGGHLADSVLYTVVGPRIRIQLATSRLGVGQYRPDGYVYSPNNVTAPLVVRLSSSNPGVAAITDSVVIPTGTSYAYFTLRALSPGSVQLNASATNYQPDSVAFAVTAAKLFGSGGGTFNNFAPQVGVTVYAADTTHNAHYVSDSLIISYTSSDTTVLRVTAADTIVPGGYFANDARVSFVGEGSAWVRFTAPGYRSDSLQYTVVRPRIQFSFDTYRIGRRQYRAPTDFYVYTPNARGDSVLVTVTQTNPAADSLSRTTFGIGAGTNFQYFGLAALQTGVDTLVVTAPGYLPDTAYVIITSPRFTGGGLPGSATTTSPPTGTTLYVADSVGNAHYSLDTLLLSARSSNDAVLQPDSVGFRLPRGAYFVQPRVRFVGPGSATITWSDSLGSGYGSVTSNAVTVTGPSLSFTNSRPVMGMRQYGLGSGAYVSIPNAIASPLVVRLVSTDPAVATVPDSVIIAAGQTFAYVDVRAQSQVGTVQLQASALGYAPATTTQQVTTPRFTMTVNGTIRTTQAPQGITIYAADANGNAHYVWEPVVITLTSSNPGAATVDSATVTIPTGGYFNNAARVVPVVEGTTTITASDERVESYRYTQASATVAIVTPPLAQSWGGGAEPLGIGQWVEPYVYTQDNQAAPLTVTVARANGAVSAPATVTIPQGTNFVYHRFTGVAVGTDTVAYTAPGHLAATGRFSVGLGRVDGIGGWPSTLSSDSVQVTLYTRDPAGNQRNVAAATTFNVSVSSGALELRSGGAAITSVTVAANTSSVSFWLRRLANGSATVTFTNANYTTHISPTVTVTGLP